MLSLHHRQTDRTKQIPKKFKTSWANARVKHHSQVHIEFLTCPDLTCPDLTLSDFTLPILTLPYLTFPDLTLPELICYNLICPDLTCPNLTCPYLTCPYSTCPYLILASFNNRPTMLLKRSVSKRLLNRQFLSYRKLLHQKLGQNFARDLLAPS